MLDPLYESSPILNGAVTDKEIDFVTGKAKSRKCPGIDMLPNEVLKSTNVKTLLRELFQLCFETGIIPSMWLRAIVKPIPKNSENDPRIPQNYRGISLLSCILKLFTSLLNSRICEFFTQNDTLVEEQNGFRADRSCVDHIFTLHSIIQKRQREKKNTFVTFIDFSKAFDCINREMLLFKLAKYGIDGKMYFIIKAMYSNTEACIKLNNLMTEWFHTVHGVRQGDNLSPTLFSVFINDLAAGLKNLGLGVPVNDELVSILLYADDVAIISENEKDMQCLLKYVNEWCKKWCMSINLTKSKVMHFRRKNVERCKTPFKLGNDELQYTDSYKYLGVYFNEFLDFENHCQVLAESGTRALGAVIAKYKNIENMGFETFTKCVETSVYPVLEYGAEVWGYPKESPTDKVQLKAMRIFLGVHKFAPNLALFGDMGWTPSSIRRKMSLLRYWNRVIGLNDNRLPKQAFICEYNSGYGKWCRSVQSILRECNQGHLYDIKSPVDIQNCTAILMKKYAEDWQRNVNAKPKLRTYCKIKKNLGTEHYVKLNLERNQRSILAQLRCGILPLNIETGRFTNTKLEDRKCTLCNSQEVEDEMHFSLACPFYENERTQFVNQLDVNIEYFYESDQLQYLFDNVPRKFSKFITRIWLKRKDHLYKT